MKNHKIQLNINLFQFPMKLNVNSIKLNDIRLKLGVTSL